MLGVAVHGGEGGWPRAGTGAAMARAPAPARALALALALALAAAPGGAGGARAPGGRWSPPGGEWWPDLGPYRFAVDSGSAEARRLASEGMALGFNFNQGESRGAWQAALRADPRCALCAWGLALSYAPFLNKPEMSAAEAAGGAEAAGAAVAAMDAKAREGQPVGARVRALVEAQAARFTSGASSAGQAAGALAYQRAMLVAAGAHPEDGDVLALAAEATMLLHCDSQGYHFWTSDRRGLIPDGELAAGLLERAAAAPLSPETAGGGGHHPFALHLQIHLHEGLVDGGAARAAGAAETLVAELGASQAGHLQHMPSHTFLRMGRYAEAVGCNVAAHASNREYLQRGRAPYGLGHNAAFLVYSADMAGLRAESREYGAAGYLRRARRRRRHGPAALEPASGFPRALRGLGRYPRRRLSAAPQR